MNISIRALFDNNEHDNFDLDNFKIKLISTKSLNEQINLAYDCEASILVLIDDYAIVFNEANEVNFSCKFEDLNCPLSYAILLSEDFTHLFNRQLKLIILSCFNVY